jgi:hypothetical protein
MMKKNFYYIISIATLDIGNVKPFYLGSLLLLNFAFRIFLIGH